MPRLKTVFVAACLALSVSSLHILDARQAVATESVSRVARIEQGLLPAVQVTNAPPVKYSLDERMAHYKVPALSIAFVENGRVMWSRAYGVGDVANGTRATVDTLFQAASISKPLSALAVLRLVQDGKLALDEDVNLKLKSWKVPENAFTKVEKVTLHRLLTHSAGTTVSGFPGYESTVAVPTTIQVLNGEKPTNTEPIRVDVEPGRRMRYSGGGFTIMQLLVGDVTGKPFPRAMRELVLDPVGMTASTYEQPLPAAMRLRATMAYQRSGEPVRGGPHTYPEMAAAGLWTTPSDLAKVALDLEAGFEGKPSRILSATMVKQMLTQQRDGYGLGIAVNGDGPALRIGHGGANAGYRCQWVQYPNRRQGVIVMTNSDAGGEVMSELLRAISAEYDWPDFRPVQRTTAPIDESTLHGLAGDYRGDRGWAVTVTLAGGRLFVLGPPFGSARVELLHAGGGDFFTQTAPLTFRFADDKQSLILQGGQDKRTLTRVKP
jgi:CubicO group peptidase (beta-lactamase class C family)